MDWDPVGLLRILCGVWFVPHLVGKLLNYEKAAGTFSAAGFRPGTLFVGLTIAMEAVATVGLVFGFYPHFAAVLAVVVLLGASYAVIKINGLNWRWQKMGPEFPLFWALICVVTIVA
ncbi:DoxX family protein [Microvirga zambiensis]|uniref:DoxX family protein n=1 Tax=Microvirga zambiensis TaxID=1402137 RepID=UPI00191D300C|nr:DoxX family protein [Microvirga zambiensis]